MRSSLEASVAAVLRDPLGRLLLASADPPWIASGLAAQDPYREAAALQRAARVVGGVDVESWWRHRIWCASRRAQGTDRPALDVVVDRPDHVEATRGHPTVLVSPMTLDTDDALALLERLTPGRERVVFGEGVTGDDVPAEIAEVSDAPGHEVPSIERVLARGGVYATYGDFAYAGRSAVASTLFGQPRAMSRGWVRLAATDGTMLLPVVMLREASDLVVAHVDEPVLVRTPAAATDLTALVELLASMLEERIRLDPAQWLLLPTLTFDASQAASSAPPPATEETRAPKPPAGVSQR